MAARQVLAALLPGDSGRRRVGIPDSEDLRRKACGPAATAVRGNAGIGG
jgi:hypothetical protein